MAVQRESAASQRCLELDFVSDELDRGQRVRTLTVVDLDTRKALSIEVGVRLHGEHVVEHLVAGRMSAPTA